MPVAFHPPLEHPIDAAPAVHTSDDSAEAGLFAAMLATAGHSPVDAAAAIRAQEAAAHAAAGRDTGSDGDKTRGDAAGTSAFDPLSAFAPWLSAPLAATLAQGAARASEPAAASDAGGAVPGADARSIAAARAANAHDLGTTSDTSATTSPPDDRPAGDITGAHGLHKSPTHPSPPQVRTNGEAPATAEGADDARGKSLPAASAPLAAPFAAIAEQLAKGAAAKSLAGSDPSSPAHAHDIDSTPGVNLAASATAPAANIAIRQVNEAVGTPGFGNEVAGEIAQLINLKSDRAQLHVHPADMGPIDVAMRIEHNRVSVMMVAGDPQTRQALEQAIPQLRDLLANQGLALADASVRDHAPRDGQGDGGNANGNARVASPGVAASLAPVSTVTNVAVRRLVDLYA